MTRDHVPPPPRRRRRTRWLLTWSAAAVAAVIAGAVWLEAIHPQLDTRGQLAIEDIPPLAVTDDTSCVRLADGEIDEELRRSVPTGGRVSSTQVYGCPSALDGLVVSYVGEAIGEVLPRRGGAWVQVNDDAYALEVGPVIGHRERQGFNTGLSVWLPDGLYEDIETVGRAGQRGDVIAVRGVLHQSDPDDGGGITLRADEVEHVADGVAIEAPFHLVQAIVAVVLAVLAIASVVWARVARNR